MADGMPTPIVTYNVQSWQAGNPRSSIVMQRTSIDEYAFTQMSANASLSPSEPGYTSTIVTARQKDGRVCSRNGSEPAAAARVC